MIIDLYFPPLVCQLLCILRLCIRYIEIQNCYIFPVKCTFYHYTVSFYLYHAFLSQSVLPLILTFRLFFFGQSCMLYISPFLTYFSCILALTRAHYVVRCFCCCCCLFSSKVCLSSGQLAFFFFLLINMLGIRFLSFHLLFIPCSIFLFYFLFLLSCLFLIDYFFALIPLLLLAVTIKSSLFFQ